MTAWLGLAQEAAPPKPPVHAEPEEEDTSAKPAKEYTFNPIQAESELKTARFYRKGGKWKAVAIRAEEATKWNPQSAEAFLMLGEARDKLNELKAARAAYEKYLQLAPEAKNAEDIRKRVAKLASVKS
jgi:outer membrane protein assembly factor BamD (BamD/ComL family)